MNNYIYKLIKEQFNIGNMDLNRKPKHAANIFNKVILDFENIYNKLLKEIHSFIPGPVLTNNERDQLNNIISAIKIKDRDTLLDIISYYSKHYPNDSLNWLNVSGITDMSYLFAKNTNNGYSFDHNKFKGDILQWDVSNVTDMSYMFYDSEFNNDISEWDVSKVTNMQYMFAYSLFNGDISMWDVSHVTDMENMFTGSMFNGDISQWDVSNVLNMYGMFKGSQFNQDISMWKVNGELFYANIFTRTKIKPEYRPKFKE